MQSRHAIFKCGFWAPSHERSLLCFSLGDLHGLPARKGKPRPEAEASARRGHGGIEGKLSQLSSHSVRLECDGVMTRDWGVIQIGFDQGFADRRAGLASSDRLPFTCGDAVPFLEKLCFSWVP